MRDSIGSTLTRAGFTVRTACDAKGALKEIASRRPDAVVTDLNMPGMSGIELAGEIQSIDDDLPVILMTAFGTIETAVQAMKNGAYDYITKPFEGDELIIALKRAIGHAAVIRENAILKANVGRAEVGNNLGVSGLDRLIGDSDAMRKVREQVRAVAVSHGTVLITGESGVGKEVVAHAVHDLSPRVDSPYLAVNCAALNESLLESELFGHEKGAFTGADALRKGRFELADQGSLLLDEISEVSPQIQAKLLRVLQERAFERVGSSITIGVDVRIIATSNRDLPHAAAMGEFRQDLFYRLNVLPILIPPLRERLDDVPMLSQFFIDQICQRDGRRCSRFDDEAIGLLKAYQWPGNVRELQNICERAVVLSDHKSTIITHSLIEPWLMTARPTPKATPLRASSLNGHGAASRMTESKPFVSNPVAANGINGHRPIGTASSFTEHKPVAEPEFQPGDRTLADLERDTIVATLHRFNGHRQKTAKALGIGVRTLGLKLKKWKEESLVSQSL
ncbi:MAG: sigma-54-dependent Fis family transcriptional regulator [Phycisphaerales bacterium]|nr:sigma-54-dependent Fis family transcriptional regulator [Phycisphaerales bacterium]